MTLRRSVVFLAIALVAFAGMVVILAVEVSGRRRDRDLTFGLEEIDVLISDGRLSEASAMLGRLAGRADEAIEMLSVLKRGVAILDAGGGSGALDSAATVGIARFPTSGPIRSLAVFAAASVGDNTRARELGTLLDDERADLFAWVLLKDNVAPPEDRPPDSDEDPFFLARLDDVSAAEDFERAWRETGDWRYAADAAVLRMIGGSPREAENLVVGASISREQPLLAADILSDAGDPSGALSALRTASSGAAAPIAARTADALMALTRYDEAARIYADFVENDPGYSPVPYLNLAWLSTTNTAALGYYDEAVRRFPESWQAVEQRALYLSQFDVDAAFESLRAYRGPSRDALATLLRLKLSPRPGSPGYEAALWSLVAAPNPPEDALRLAAWYFAGLGEFASVGEVLDRAREDRAWVHTYTGLMAASEGSWNRAHESFSLAFDSGPGWRTAYNVAVSELALGENTEGLATLEDAERLAREAGLPSATSAIFVAIARTSGDPRVAIAAVDSALQLDPTNADGLLVRRLLESGSTY